MASEVGSGLRGGQRPPRSAAVMFQYFDGFCIGVFNKCSQEEKKEEDKMDM